MQGKTFIGFNLLLIGLVLLGCGRKVIEIPVTNQTPVVVTQLVTVVVVVTATPEPESMIDPSVLPTNEVGSISWVLPIEAGNYVGKITKVRVESARCSFQSNTVGTPTFCNDQPYPEHSFTFLVWGEDWSHLDQQCVVVEGLVELYQGKPQIEISTLEQISACED